MRYLACAALLLPLLAGAAPRPNIVFMIADDLGYGDVGCYGATKIRTPNLDRLAAQGVRFTDAHSAAAVCNPSRYAILSGTYLWHAQRKNDYSLYFHEGQVTLPSLLQSAGYCTAALGKWHNGFGRNGDPEAGAYGDFVQQLDHCAGQVLEALDRSGLATNTLVIFTSDNGAVLTREALAVGHRSNGVLQGQKTDAWEGGHRVPLLARWPGRIPAGSVRQALFAQVDVMATLAQAAGVGLPAGASPDGASELAAFLDPAGAPAKRTEAVFLGTGGHALRQDNWVLLPKQGSCGMTVQVPPGAAWGQPYAKLGLTTSDVDSRGQVKPDAPPVQLYDLGADPGQARNRAAAEPARAEAMRLRLEELVGRPRAARRPPRPNIVFILADDMRWDAMSCAGHPLLKTPHLDRLAVGGTRFANAFVTTAICAVSRASILTGQYARRHGIHDFRTPIADLGATYPSRLRGAGYYTGFIGKWGTAQNDRAYFQRCAASFDFWAGDMQQTAYWHARACNYLANDGTAARTNFFCSCPPDARRAEGCGPDGPHPSLTDPVHAETEFVPAKVRSFLDQRDTAKPFCLSLSLKAPHGPWRGYAPRFAADFEGAAIPRRGSVTRAEALRQPDFLRRSLESERGLRLAEDAEERNRLFREYYRLIEGVDFCVGEVLAELDRRGLAGNTVIVFTSDNGHFAGEHGFFGKWFMHEESIRVPLLVYDPRAPAAGRGRVAEALALNLDIAPTLLELAGVPAPPALQGRSLLPLLRDPAAPWRDAFFYEHLYTHAPAPPRHIEPSEGVRTREAKYIVWLEQAGPAPEELYDLRVDPLEMRNLAAEPSATALLAELRRAHAEFRVGLE